MDTVARGEMVEAELDAMIRRRDEKRRAKEGEHPAEALWQEGCRRHEEKEYRGSLWERLRFHEQMVRNHTTNFEAIVGRHRKEAARYADLLGLTPLDESGKRNGHKKGKAA